MQANEHLKLLGFKAKDKVTGFKGVIASVCFDLYGCIQACLTPEVNSDGTAKDGRWFDMTRLELKGKKPVMDQPDFGQGYVAEGRKGCAENRPG